MALLLRTWAAMAACLVFFLVCACDAPARDSARESGIASWYGPRFHGRTTANGERFNMYAMTAAHKHLAFGTVVRVRQKSSGRSVVVRINDRGPFYEGRIIDLSRSAAQALGMDGISAVSLDIVGNRKGKPFAASQRFFVRLSREDDPQAYDDEQKAAQLVRFGVRDAATLLRRHGGVSFLGPFPCFHDAHDVFARIEFAHPGAGITLLDAHGPEPVFPEYQSE